MFDDQEQYLTEVTYVETYNCMMNHNVQCNLL